MSKDLTKVKIVSAIGCFLILFLSIYFWSTVSQKIANQAQNTLIQELTIGNAIQIENLLAATNNSAKLLTSALEQHKKEFSRLEHLANMIVDNYPEVEQIRLSPNNITSYVFPKVHSLKYVGKSIVSPLSHPQASHTHKQFYSTPQLVNSDYIIKSHIPVSIDNKHWGYITYHINLAMIMKQAQLAHLDMSKYSYQLVHVGAFNKSIILAQSQTPLQKEYYTAAVRAPNNQWYLKLSANNATNDPLFYINLAFGIMLASVFALIGYLGISEPSRIKQNMKRLMQRFEYQQLILDKILENANDEIYVSDRNGKVYLSSSNTTNNQHIPANISLQDSPTKNHDAQMFERDGRTPIQSNEHPLNQALFNNETVVKEVVLTSCSTESYLLELKSQPIFDALHNKVGALCIARKMSNNNALVSPNNSRSTVLDMLAHDKPIKSIFEHIINETQSKLEDVCAAITLINPKTQQINDVVSKDLPSFYIDALIGLQVNDRVMSNASAIYHDQLIITEDINVHPFWVDYKALAQQANLRSCWSQPIHDANNNVLGTIDIYSSTISKAAPASIMLLKEAAILCSLTLERHRDSQRLHKMSLAVQHSSNAVVITDSDGIIEYINPHYSKVTGYSPIEVLGSLIPTLDHTLTPSHIIDDINVHIVDVKKWQGELKGHTRKRGDFWAMVSVTPILSDSHRINHLVFVLEDVTQLDQRIDPIDYQHSRDPLTNLFNRQAFEYRLEFLLAKAYEELRIHSLCVINIDQYKSLALKFGNHASDQLLKLVSQILSQNLRRRDTLARLGSDHFVVLMEDCDTTSAINTIKELCTQMDGFKFDWACTTFNISLSIGISAITSQSKTTEQVISHADMACNKAKISEEQHICIYQEHNEQLTLTGDMYWAEKIKIALQQKQFQLFVQPIVAIKGADSKCYEVLLRLCDEQNVLIEPNTFLPAAARYNLSLAIDKYVIKSAITWCLSQDNLKQTIDKIYINLSADALTNESFINDIIQLSDDNNQLFSLFIFEFSEYHLLSNLSHCKRFMSALSPTGCQFSIDNFGQGLSAFTHLRDLPVSYIKIDGTLIKSIVDDPIAEATVQSILHLSQALNIDIVATNVENDDIANKLHKYNVTYAQGFLLGKPFLLNNMR